MAKTVLHKYMYADVIPMTKKRTLDGPAQASPIGCTK